MREHSRDRRALARESSMSKPAQYIRHNQLTKIRANRARITDAREREEREQELIRQLNQTQKTKETVTQI
jgi:hypothetical protein